MLKNILSKEQIPILRLKMTDQGLELDVVASSPKIRYIAISHVWADGLGNPHRNDLKACQLKYLWDCLKNLYAKSRSKMGSIYVWIDTLCCPLEPQLQTKALGLTRETYSCAAAVLVLDAELEMTASSKLDHLEILHRIALSTWMTRL